VCAGLNRINFTKNETGSQESVVRSQESVVRSQESVVKSQEVKSQEVKSQERVVDKLKLNNYTLHKDSRYVKIIKI
jgi:K+/H+ antiporter YhaU regulatory subunit KhtT